jgi:hypothetical protein
VLNSAGERLISLEDGFGFVTPEDSTITGHNRPIYFLPVFVAYLPYRDPCTLSRYDGMSISLSRIISYALLSRCIPFPSDHIRDSYGTEAMMNSHISPWRMYSSRVRPYHLGSYNHPFLRLGIQHSIAKKSFIHALLNPVSTLPQN